MVKHLGQVMNEDYVRELIRAWAVGKTIQVQEYDLKEFQLKTKWIDLDKDEAERVIARHLKAVRSGWTTEIISVRVKPEE